ncbi:MAG TPA: DUF2169 domain-containing protein [Gemmatimonadaceae bacterium]|nr:DUF2169 domain-containing protein [Gemmatimonadaceae bacterium]
MAHPEIDNRTPFAFAPLFIADEDGRPVVVPIVKATFAVTARGDVTLGEKQALVDFKGKLHGEPAKSSPRFEPETAFVKQATDCVLLGHAVSTHPTTQMDVGIRIGPVSKAARVTGNRWWLDGAIGLTMSPPEPFRLMPLVYERAFGGWDRTPEKEDDHSFEPRNPVGVGFMGKRGFVAAGSPLPNIEDPASMVTSPGARGKPVGFGFVGVEWQPRAGFAGTYDEEWTKNRSPLLPRDFDRRFFSAASEGLIAPGYLRGDELVQAFGVTPDGKWEFRLPGIDPPTVTTVLRFGEDVTLWTNLDTVIVDADARTLTLIWRAFTGLRSGPHDVKTMRIATATAIRATPLEAAVAVTGSGT